MKQEERGKEKQLEQKLNKKIEKKCNKIVLNFNRCFENGCGGLVGCGRSKWMGTTRLTCC